jgi:hypothetical protein
MAQKEAPMKELPPMSRVVARIQMMAGLSMVPTSKMLRKAMEQ